MRLNNLLEDTQMRKWKVNSDSSKIEENCRAKSSFKKEIMQKSSNIVFLVLIFLVL